MIIGFGSYSYPSNMFVTFQKSVICNDRVFIRHQRSENSSLTMKIHLLMFSSLWLFFIQMRSLFQNNYSPVTLHLSHATRILKENPAIMSTLNCSGYTAIYGICGYTLWYIHNVDIPWDLNISKGQGNAKICSL